jgi:hypothetical protein
MAKDNLQNLTLKKAAMLEALEKSLGVVTTAAKSIGITRESHYEWMRTDENYKAKVLSLADVALDFAESQLHKQIQNGEVASTIFFLKTKGKHRGYTGDGNKVTVNDQDGKTITVEYSS